jgi:hypothetical protein
LIFKIENQFGNKAEVAESDFNSETVINIKEREIYCSAESKERKFLSSCKFKFIPSREELLPFPVAYAIYPKRKKDPLLHIFIFIIYYLVFFFHISTAAQNIMNLTAE